MNYKTLISALFLVAIITLPAYATKWRVNNNLTAPTQVDYNQLKAAVEDDVNVLSGDTIYVEASGIPYEGEIQLYKRLTIIGPGYLLGQPHIQPSVCGTQNAATIGGKPGISLNEGSNGTFITGLNFVTTSASPVSINIGDVSNITITRNRLEEIAFEYGTSNQSHNLQNISITRNLIKEDIGFGCYCNISNLRIANNLIGGEINRNCGNTTSFDISGIVEYNTLLGSVSGILWVKGCDIQYNMVGLLTADPASNGMIQNNRLGFLGTINQAIVDYNASNEINPYIFTSWDYDTDDWALDELSDLDTTHGAHNGWDPINPNHPISKANLPAWPTIYECAVQPCGDDNIQVQFQVRTNH